MCQHNNKQKESHLNLERNRSERRRKIKWIYLNFECFQNTQKLSSSSLKSLCCLTTSPASKKRSIISLYFSLNNKSDTRQTPAILFYFLSFFVKAREKKIQLLSKTNR